MDHLKVQNELEESSDGEIIEDISKIDDYENSDNDDIPIFFNADSDFSEKKRQLFDIESDDRFFLEDVDQILSPDNIAKHFKAAELEELKENIVPSNNDNEKLQKFDTKAADNAHKELSPLNEDVILINDKKVSISSLKKVQDVPYKSEKEFSSLNFPKVPPGVSLRTSHSLDIDLNDSSGEESTENENLATDPEQNSTAKITTQKDENQSGLKKMEKITPDYLKEPLDDITEESETESKEPEVVPESVKASMIERGSHCRALLHNSLFVNRKDEPGTEQISSMDLQNKSIKELQDIVIEKDSCLDALNLQLNALIRRENFKEFSGRESSAPYSFATTTSTEYRTINEDFNLKILDIENELHDRATCIENLKLQLSESDQERKNLKEKILLLQAKIEGNDSMKNSDDDKTAIPASRINDFKQSLNEEEAACFSKIWIKLEMFLKNQLEQFKLNYEEEIKKIQITQKCEKKESDAEINRLRQLISTINSESPAVNELRCEMEKKHEKEMQDLREYFEKRCLDMEKQYSEEVFSQHSRKMEDSDNETIPDEESINALEPYNEKINEIITLHNPPTDTFLALSNDFNPYNELQKIKVEYDQRLAEQVALAREDVLHEIEKNIQALISENTRDDKNWPPELILLREKLTAKDRLEIVQLQIKHEEEMARMKSEYDLNLQRKLKRHAAFDAHRDLDKIINERDSLRELSVSLRFALCELAKYFTQYEQDKNNTIHEELNKTGGDELNISAISSTTKRFLTYKPDISNLISVVEDPQLLEFISKNTDDENGGSVQINIVDCLERLKLEANNILGLSEELYKRNFKWDSSIDKLSDKTDSCEEEDGLKRIHCKSLETFDKPLENDAKTAKDFAQSLPIFFENLKHNELQEKIIDLKSQLVKSEDEKRNIKEQLNEVLKRSGYLENDLKDAKIQLESLNIQKETLTEGFGAQSPLQDKNVSLIELQEKAKGFLITSPNNSAVDNSVALYQLVEDFCRETDQFMDNEKRNRIDLEHQLDVADKQLKANRKFLEEQAADREQERDEFTKELEKLRIIIKEKEKDKTSHDNYEKEIGSLEQQIKDLNAQAEKFSEQKLKYEQDLKASIDKAFDLREIIANLEAQIQAKTLNENVLIEKCKELENYIQYQNQTNESLKEELDIEEKGYIEKIKFLEDQLKIARPSNEQKILIEQMTSQLKTVEMLLDRKTKTLEAYHALASTCSTTCSSPSEDVSRGIDVDGSEKSPIRICKMSTEGSDLPFEEVHRILEKLSKHNRVEEATVKKVTDLEMTIHGMKNNFAEIQQEKDILQERMSEQLMKISSLQSRLDEQRIRAEELNKQSTSDLTLRVHDLQNELASLRETLTARDKQISNLNQLLEHSKKIIERQDQELAFSGDNDKSFNERLSEELKRKNDEIDRLKEKINSEIMNKAMIPDLMETMMAEKNEEIDNLKEQISSFITHQNRQTIFKTTPPSSTLGGTALSMISEYEEPDMLRQFVRNEFEMNPISLPLKLPNHTFQFGTFEQEEILTDKATIDTSEEHSHNQMPSHLIPRKINFTSSDESSVLNDACKLRNELEKITREKNEEIEILKTQVQKHAEEISNLLVDLEAKSKLYDEVNEEKLSIERELDNLKLNIMQLSVYETTVKKKEEELNNSLIKIQQLELTIKSQNQDLENLRTVLNERDENIKQLNENLIVMQDKCKENERVLIDLERLKKQVNSYNDIMMEKENLLKKLEIDLVKYAKSERELLDKAEQCDKLLEINQQLEVNVENLRHELCVKTFTLEKCRIDLHEIEQKTSLKHNEENVRENFDNISIDDIASKLERELNYSAELDGNIIKAIESESEINLDLEELGGKRPNKYEEKIKKMKIELHEQKLMYEKLMNELEEEKKHSDGIHMQDASLIESMNIRLKTALENESVLKKLLDSERQKTTALSSHLSGIQRTKSFDNNLLFQRSSLNPDSPRRLAKLNELESEVIQRLESEIKLLTSQNDCERDRVIDLQKVLDRERERFNRALSDQQTYCDQLKREVQRLISDKQILENELDHLQELKHKFFELEKENFKLEEINKVLGQEGNSGNFNNEVPRDFMHKLEKINKALDENVRENHQMNETLQKLINERHALQQKIVELESNSNVVPYTNTVSTRDLEEQNNYLIARYMRSESFRKALVFQKRFLLITLSTTIGSPQLPLFKCNPRKKRSFRSIALIVIAIERFKFIARRWTGKRMMTKILYTSPPKRSQSASNNNWATFNRLENNLQLLTTPPSRERASGFLLPSTTAQPKQSSLARLQSLFHDTQ